MKQESLKSLEEQKKEYGAMGNTKIVGKDSLVEFLKNYRNGLKEYINNIYLQKDGHIREDAVRVTAADKIVTMATCTGNSATRWLVVGVLRNQEPGAYQELPDESATKAAVSVSSYQGQ